MRPKSDFRILLLDDEPSVVKYLSELLHQNGYHVLPLNSPEDALDHAEYLHFEMALIGIMMPGLSGVEVADRLQERLRNCKILLMDGTDLVEAVIPHRGDFGYLEFPLDTREFLDRIRDAHSTSCEHRLKTWPRG